MYSPAGRSYIEVKYMQSLPLMPRQRLLIPLLTYLAELLAGRNPKCAKKKVAGDICDLYLMQ
jgi:hypothetical protein